jgi:AraC-like DNA-binding protein
VPSPSIWPKLPRPDPRRDLVARIERLEAALLARLRPLPPQAQTIRDVIERIEHARDWLKAEQIAAHLKVSLRTAQRRFQRHAGVSPKWVIRRYRLIEAADAIRLEPTRPFADLAVELGYFDQSHFTRDFAALIGQTPSAFAAAVRLSAPSSSS